MTEEAETLSFISDLPTEIIFKIFSNLSPKELFQMRGVCLRWKAIVDSIISNDSYWRNQCNKDWNNYFLTAKRKAHPDLCWFHLYRSLSVWSKLDEAKEQVKEVSTDDNYCNDVQCLTVLGKGKLGILKVPYINHYYGNAVRDLHSSLLCGNYVPYTSNDQVNVFQVGEELFIFQMEPNKTETLRSVIPRVKMYILTDTELYYAKTNDKIFKADIYNGEKMKSKMIGFSPTVMSLGYKDGCLNVLTYECNIYTVRNNRLVFELSLKNKENIMHLLYIYNFLENLDCSSTFPWIYPTHFMIPDGSLRDITVIRYFGDIFFMGTEHGVVNIFYRPFINGELDLFNTKPMREIDCRLITNNPNLNGPILQIDVIENKKGHAVYIALPKKFIELKFIHKYFHLPDFTNEPLPKSDLELLLDASESSE